MPSLFKSMQLMYEGSFSGCVVSREPKAMRRDVGALFKSLGTNETIIVER